MQLDEITKGVKKRSEHQGLSPSALQHQEVREKNQKKSLEGTSETEKTGEYYAVEAMLRKYTKEKELTSIIKEKPK